MRIDSIRAALATVLSAVLLVSGCSEGLPVAPVSGTIMYQGQPLVGATITTQPMSSDGNREPGSGSFGKTDAEGRYRLEVVEPAIEGAILGTHRVTITRAAGSVEETDAFVARDRSWPERFTNGSLSLEVPEGGRQDANFDLTAE